MTRGVKEPVIKRLLSRIKINPDTECWEWQGGLNNIGYGLIRQEKKMRTVHRVSYEEHYNKQVPKDMCVLHTCDNRKCVNPDHLWIGTHQDNVDDMMRKNRHQYNHEKVACEHCGKKMQKSLYVRWHGDNCKHKPKDK